MLGLKEGPNFRLNLNDVIYKKYYIFRMVIYRMKEAVKCLEDFDMAACPGTAVANGQPIIIEEGSMAAA